MSAAPIFTANDPLPEGGEAGPADSSSQPGSGLDAFPLACRGRELLSDRPRS